MPARPVRQAQDLSGANRHNAPALGGSQPKFAPKAPREKYSFTPYQAVQHDRFGRGTVLEVANGVLTVEFDSCGVKKIVADLAPIRPAK